METTKQSARRRLIGTVKSAKMAKTVVVTIERKIQHPKYGKTYAVSRSFKVHDAEAKAHVGDVIEIEEIRPLSSQKRWRYVRTVKAQTTL
ncbi:MAG: 30S ribosomal protein S17 [Patescibacteria group bacterium]